MLLTVAWALLQTRLSVLCLLTEQRLGFLFLCCKNSVCTWPQRLTCDEFISLKGKCTIVVFLERLFLFLLVFFQCWVLKCEVRVPFCSLFSESCLLKVLPCGLCAYEIKSSVCVHKRQSRIFSTSLAWLHSSKDKLIRQTAGMAVKSAKRRGGRGQASASLARDPLRSRQVAAMVCFSHSAVSINNWAEPQSTAVCSHAFQYCGYSPLWGGMWIRNASGKSGFLFQVQGLRISQWNKCGFLWEKHITRLIKTSWLNLFRSSNIYFFSQNLHKKKVFAERKHRLAGAELNHGTAKTVVKDNWLYNCAHNWISVSPDYSVIEPEM